MTQDEKEMQATKIMLMKIALVLGGLFSLYIIWRTETIVELLKFLPYR